MCVKKDWLNPKINIQSSSITGKGIFANSKIERGEKIVVWGDEYTNKMGADEVCKKNMLVMQWDDDLYSYEVCGENDGYFINHSCDPNAWLADAFTVVAMRNIMSHEEITADYAIWEADENYISEWECKCGSSLCRGRITGIDWKNPNLQKRYKDHFSPLLNKRIQRLKDSKEDG